MPEQEFSDEEMAFLRHAQFGELKRVRPQEWVPMTETEPRRDLPEPDPSTIAQPG